MCVRRRDCGAPRMYVRLYPETMPRYSQVAWLVGLRWTGDGLVDQFVKLYLHWLFVKQKCDTAMLHIITFYLKALDYGFSNTDAQTYRMNPFCDNQYFCSH